MNLINVIIVDDEPRARSVLSNLLNVDFPEIKIVAEASSVPMAVQQIKKHKPQLVFLDVQMPKYDGYEIIDFIDEIDFDIIFITAFDHYAIRAFEINAIDYLVKPIDRARLKTAIVRANDKINHEDKSLKYDTLLETIKHKKFDKLVLPEQGKKQIIELANLIAIEADGAYTHIHVKGLKTTTISKNLRYFENVLIDDERFFRAHRSWIVNIYEIESINRTECTLQLPSNIQARISRSQYAAFDALFTDD